MPTIAGPKVQMPPSLGEIHQQTEDGRTVLRTEWASFLHSVQQVTWNSSRSGPTASRPTSTLDGRWIGMPYFDTTLGYTIHLKSVNPDVWVNGAGAAV